MQYHIKIKKYQVPEYVILTGDPKRTLIIAEYLDSYKQIFDEREFKIFSGYINGYRNNKIKLLVASTGIGCPSAAICIEELSYLGAKVFIKVGTAGAIQKNIKIGDIVIPISCVREDGTSTQYIPISYPACANVEVVNAIIQASKNLNVKHYVGITHCKDAFYSELPTITPLRGYHEKLWKIWQDSNVLATSMETSILFILGSIRKLLVGEILTIVGYTFLKKLIFKEVNLKNSIHIAIETIKILDKNLYLY